MMKAAEYKDGKTIYRDMTPEEIAEIDALTAQTSAPSPTPEQMTAWRAYALSAGLGAVLLR